MVTAQEGWEGRSWHVASRGQGHCRASSKAQDTPNPAVKNYLASRVNNVEVEKPCFNPKNAI